MNQGAVGLIIAIGICYVILTVLIPALFLYRFIKHRRFAVRFAVYQVAGNAWLVLVGFVLSLLNIWSEPLVVVLTLVLPCILNIVLFHRNIFVSWRNYIDDKKEGLVTKAGMLRSIRTRAKKQIRTLFDRYIRYHYFEIIILVALAVFAVWYYGYFKMHFFTYASSDEATHLYWVNAMFAGHPFPVGMYPHSMHFTIAAIHSMSGMQTLIINHYFSVIIMLMLHFMLFLTVKVLFNSAAAAIGSVGFFLLSGMYIGQRYHNTLPMEYGFLAMFAMIILLTEFMKHRDRISMWMAALATGWTFHAHFYVTIMCAFVWAAFLLVYLKTIIRLKAVLKTLLLILLSAAFAIAPFAIGFAAGHPFEQSIGWAMGVMGVSSEEDSTLKLMLSGINREEETEDPDSVREEEAEEKENEEPAYEEEKPERQLTHYEREFIEAKTGQEYISAFEHLLTGKFVNDENDALLLYVLLVFAILYGVFDLIYAHFSFRKKHLMTTGKESEDTGSLRERKRSRACEKQEYIVRNGIALAVPVMIIFAGVCYSMSFFGFPEIVDSNRAGMILAPLTALLFAPPVKCIENLLMLIPLKNKRIIANTTLLLAGAGLGAFYAYGPVKQLDVMSAAQVTQQLSNELSYDLIGTHPRNTWTIISPVNDLLAIHYYGYHYEVIDLLMDIENGEEVIYMPTNDLYVVVEKETMNATGISFLPDYQKGVAEQSIEQDEGLRDVNFYDIGLPWMAADEAYKMFRNVTMTKLSCWIEELKKTYPNEVEVYAEDDTCIVYHIRQSADFPLNLAVDYRDKNKGLKARDDFERRYAEKHGLEYEENE